MQCIAKVGSEGETVEDIDDKTLGYLAQVQWRS